MAKEIGSPRDISGENGIFDVVYTLKGVLISYIISIVLLLLVSVIATYAAMPEAQIRIAVNIVTAVSLIICGFRAARRARRMGLVNGAAAGLIYTILLYVVGSLITRELSFTLSTVTTLILGFICGGLGGVMGLNMRRKK